MLLKITDLNKLIRFQIEKKNIVKDNLCVKTYFKGCRDQTNFCHYFIILLHVYFDLC